MNNYDCLPNLSLILPPTALFKIVRSSALSSEQENHLPEIHSVEHRMLGNVKTLFLDILWSALESTRKLIQS
jgi:hypothetical protein